MKIIGTGSYLPDYVLTNDDLTQMVDTDDEWISSRTGIKERRIAKKESVATMAASAAKAAIQQSGLTADAIQWLLVSTSSAESYFPSVACQVQEQIGAVNAVCLDVNAACSGFIFAMEVLSGFINNHKGSIGLVIGSEAMSKLVNWSDRGTCVLFGDGAGAALISGTGVELTSQLHSDGTKGAVLECKTGQDSQGSQNYLTMNGQEVFKFAVRQVPFCMEQLLAKVGLCPQDIDFYLLHQANSRIINGVAKRLGVSLQRFPTNLERYGNTSSASIPILLDDLNRNGRLKPGMKLIFAGFGAGLTWGCSLLEW